MFLSVTFAITLTALICPYSALPHLQICFLGPSQQTPQILKTHNTRVMNRFLQKDPSHDCKGGTSSEAPPVSFLTWLSSSVGNMFWFLGPTELDTGHTEPSQTIAQLDSYQGVMMPGTENLGSWRLVPRNWSQLERKKTRGFRPSSSSTSNDIIKTRNLGKYRAFDANATRIEPQSASRSIHEPHPDESVIPHKLLWVPVLGDTIGTMTLNEITRQSSRISSMPPLLACTTPRNSICYDTFLSNTDYLLDSATEITMENYGSLVNRQFLFQKQQQKQQQQINHRHALKKAKSKAARKETVERANAECKEVVESTGCAIIQKDAGDDELMRSVDGKVVKFWGLKEVFVFDAAEEKSFDGEMTAKPSELKTDGSDKNCGKKFTEKEVAERLWEVLLDNERGVGEKQRTGQRKEEGERKKEKKKIRRVVDVF